jgi:hypothetical protein
VATTSRWPRFGVVHATIVLVQRLQLVLPKQVPSAVVEQDVEGRVAGVAPPLGYRSLLASQARRAKVILTLTRLPICVSLGLMNIALPLSLSPA